MSNHLRRVRNVNTLTHEYGKEEKNNKNSKIIIEGLCDFRENIEKMSNFRFFKKNILILVGDLFKKKNIEIKTRISRILCFEGCKLQFL